MNFLLEYDYRITPLGLQFNYIKFVTCMLRTLFTSNILLINLYVKSSLPVFCERKEKKKVNTCARLRLRNVLIHLWWDYIPLRLRLFCDYSENKFYNLRITVMITSYLLCVTITQYSKLVTIKRMLSFLLQHMRFAEPLIFLSIFI